MEDIRIALAITGSTVGKKTANLANVERWAIRARDQGAALLCFPELNLTGYSNHPDIVEAAETIPGPCSDRLAAIAEGKRAHPAGRFG